MPQRIRLTEIRPRLSELLALVTSAGEQVVITRFDKPVAALVSMADLRRIWDDYDEEVEGPIDPRSGRPFGRAWVEALWEGRYRREDDPDAHLHPARREAPWLGRPFDWPPAAEPEPAPEAAPEAPPAPPDGPDPGAQPADAPGRLARIVRWLRPARAN